jgi:hypothetical protein
MTKTTRPAAKTVGSNPADSVGGDAPDTAAAKPQTAGSDARNVDIDRRFRVVMLAHAMSVDARLTSIETTLALLRLATVDDALRDAIAELPDDKEKGGRPRDTYADFLGDLYPAQFEATKRATEKVIKDCPDIPPEHVKRILVSFMGTFYDEETADLRARAEARYRTRRGSGNPKAALRKALLRRRKLSHDVVPR